MALLTCLPGSSRDKRWIDQAIIRIKKKTLTAIITQHRFHKNASHYNLDISIMEPCKMATSGPNDKENLNASAGVY